MNPFSTLYQLIVNIFSSALEWLFAFTGNYALAIMLLTVIFNMAFIPIRINQVRGSKIMRLLQPRINSINKKYKGDQKKGSEETMALWNKYNYNPLSGCIPLLLQLPLFWAILEVFRGITFPEGAASSFIWIQNISQVEPDFMGLPLKILPVLAGVASYLQTKFMNAGAPVDQNTQMMTVMMPFMMVYICWGQPASLSIYWTTSQIVYALQQVVLQRYIIIEIDPDDLLEV